METMTDKKFNQVKVMAEVFAKEHIENRIQNHALVALDNLDDLKYWPDDFPYIVDSDIACMNGIAHINLKWEEEVDSAVDVFYIKYFNLDIYHSGECKDVFTDPMGDLGMTFQQVQAIKDIIRDEMFYGSEDSPYNNEEIVDEIFGYLQHNQITENQLMNDVDDLLK